MFVLGLDAALLDAELFATMREEFKSALSWLDEGLCRRYSPEITAFLKTVMFYGLVGRLDKTYSQGLLRLRYVCSKGVLFTFMMTCF